MKIKPPIGLVPVCRVFTAINCKNLHKEIFICNSCDGCKILTVLTTCHPLGCALHCFEINNARTVSAATRRNSMKLQPTVSFTVRTDTNTSSELLYLSVASRNAETEG